MAFSIVRKLSLKTMQAESRLGRAERVHVARVYGKATGIKEVPSKFSGEPETGFTGEFYGENPAIKDTVFSAKTAWLPGIITDLLRGAVTQGEVDDDGKLICTPVEFGFDIYASPASGEVGYTFDAVPLMDAQEADIVTRMRSQFPALEYRAPAPAAPVAQVTDETKAEEPAEEPAKEAEKAPAKKGK